MRDESIEAVAGDLTTQHVDVIVNAANSSLLGGGGVDGAIHRAAGPQLLAACRRLRAEQFPDGLPVGEAVATPGFGLPAAWVVHTVGPNRHAGQTDPALLTSCFTTSLDVADALPARSVAFPAISAGVYGWDVGDVARIAVAAVRSWEAAHVELVRFVRTPPRQTGRSEDLGWTGRADRSMANEGTDPTVRTGSGGTGPGAETWRGPSDAYSEGPRSAAHGRGRG